MFSVLVVDDDENIRKVVDLGLTDYFRKMHQSGALSDDDKIMITIAKDGAEAIAIMQKRPASLVVTDIQMPRINGLKLLSYMSEYHKDIPCIVMTGYSSPTVKQKVIRDIIHYIEKPFKIDKLGKMILSVLLDKKKDWKKQGMSIASFLQLIEMEGQSCLLQIETPNEKMGYLYIKDGQLYEAVFEGLEGKDAALKLIPMEAVKINILKLPSKRLQKRIEVKNLMTLTIEAMKAAEEAG